MPCTCGGRLDSLGRHRGACSQLAVDVPLRSATTSCGAACTNAANMDRRDKETKYDELVDGARCHLVVVAIEPGERWSDESMNFISDLAPVSTI